MKTDAKQVLCYTNLDGNKLYRVGTFRNVSYTEDFDKATNYYEENNIIKYYILMNFKQKYPKNLRDKINFETIIYLSGKMDASFGGLLKRYSIWELMKIIFTVLFNKNEEK